jgi:hypothetical protein
VDLTRFPRQLLSRGSTWYRQHQLGPWYFDASPQGRFNLDAPRGTCYLASTPEAAAREFIGRDVARAGFVAAGLLRERYVSELLLPHDAGLAHLQDRRALGFGVVSNELCHMTPYDVPRTWARAFDAAGFGGIWYTLRYSTAAPRAVALFGPAGPRDDWPVAPHPRALRNVVSGMRVRVLQTPGSAELTVIAPPSPDKRTT